jgi:hypothetical protein
MLEIVREFTDLLTTGVRPNTLFADRSRIPGRSVPCMEMLLMPNMEDEVSLPESRFLFLVRSVTRIRRASTSFPTLMSISPGF